MGHRRFLPPGHKFRLARTRFDGNVETRNPPLSLPGSDILAQVQNIEVEFGKDVDWDGLGKRPRATNIETQQWRKKSIFFDLPYWETNLIRHNLDVMHIEKNVCDNVLFTLLNDSVKSKDHLKARKDLQEMGFRRDLWPDESGKYPPALFTMTNADKDVFLKILKDITVPDGYSSNISRCIDLRQRKIAGLKSHDSHILMEQLLPLALRKTLPKQVSAVLIDLCSFFRLLCNKVLSVNDLDKLQARIIHTLCHLEMLFPPSFFTVMVHLTVHLVEEAKLGGPVHYRWMYPLERYLGKLKSYVRNKAQPEGSIAEGYVAQEALTFCSRYLEGVETTFNQRRRVDDEPDVSSNDDTLFPPIGRPIGGFEYFNLSPMEMLQAHRHVLINCKDVEPFLQEFRDIVKRQSRGRTRNPNMLIEKRVHREFVDWFSKRINNAIESFPVDLIFLARGPLIRARRFTAYNVNGYRFRTVNRDQGMKTQNSGVFGTFGTRRCARGDDGQIQFGEVPYYGKIVDIIELNYRGRFQVTLFKCIWANTTNPRGLMTDSYGITSVSFERLIHTGDNADDEPYIKVSEAQLVYYVNDGVNNSWSAVVHVKPRDLFDMGEDEDEISHEIEPYRPQNLDDLFPDDDSIISLARQYDDNDNLDKVS